MRFYSKFTLLVLVAAFALAACTSAPKKNSSPLETLKEYGDAYKKKDITAMKLLLSEETLKMHEQEAKAQNTTVDEIVKRETLFSENQKTADFRNQKIEDQSATIEMKDAGGIWNTVHFVKEDGAWKIDRKSDAEKIQRDVEQKQNELDQIINQGRIDNANAATDPSVTTLSNANAPANVIANVDANANVNANAQP